MGAEVAPCADTTINAEHAKHAEEGSSLRSYAAAMKVWNVRLKALQHAAQFRRIGCLPIDVRNA